jgi:CheY-like chemotaxis protein
MASILLVEDVELVRALMREFLESAGHSVTDCEGGEEATRLTRRRRFDAVVTDIRMKNGDGLEFIRGQQSKPSPTPIIAITGGDPDTLESQAARQARRAGATQVLMKPVMKGDLLAAVAEALAVS